MCSQQLTYQERMLSCVDSSVWKLEDKAWVKARKAQWAEMSKKLKGRDKTTLPLLENRTINYWKSYFLSGELASTEHLVSSIGLEINPFFIMWFHPDQSEPNLRQLLLRLIEIFEIGGWDVRIDMAKYGLSILRRCHFGLSLQKNLLLGADGVFGGQERLYLRLLFGVKEDGFINAKIFGALLNFNFFNWLAAFLLDVEADPNYPKLELVDYALFNSTSYEVPDVDWQLSLQRIVLQIILYFDEVKQYMRDDSLWQHNATVAVNKIKKALESNQLAPQLQQEWQFVRDNVKKQLITNGLLEGHGKSYVAYQSVWRRFID